MKDIRSRRTTAVAVGAAIWLLVLAGCATPSGVGATGAPQPSTPESGAPAESPTPTAESPTPTADPTPTEDPAPSPEPTATQKPTDPADVATWVIAEDAIGPFTLGMPWSDAVAKATELGWKLDYAQPDPNGGCAVNVHWGEPGRMGITIWGDADAVYDMTVTDNANPEADDPRPATAEGITVHSTTDEVRAAYPAAKEGSVPIASDRFFLGVDADGDGQGMYFEWRGEDGVIGTVSVNAHGAPAYEHC